MKNIKAKEPEKEKEKTKMEKLKDRFKSPIKRMEMIANKYDIDKEVILHQNALTKALIYYSVTQKTQGDKEIMGWLAGKKDNGNIEIVDAYIGNCNSSTCFIEMELGETTKMKKMAKERGLELVGNWHSHPGMSTSPSAEDDDYMRNIEKFGMKSPVQLIVNSDNFSLTVMNNLKRRKVDFIIPPKIDNHIGLNLGYMNGEYKTRFGVDGFASPYGYEYFNDEEFCIVAFFGLIGNSVFSILSYIPFVDLIKYIDLGGKQCKE